MRAQAARDSETEAVRRLESFKQRLFDQSQTIDNLQTENRKLNSTVRQLDSEKHAATLELSQSKTLLQNEVSNSATMREKTCTLEARVDGDKRAAQAHAADLAEHREKVARLTKDLATARSYCDEVNATCDKALVVRDANNKMLAEVKQQLANALQDIEKNTMVAADLAVARGQIQELEARLAASGIAQQKFKEQHASVLQDVATRDASNKVLLDQVSLLHQSVADTKSAHKTTVECVNGCLDAWARSLSESAPHSTDPAALLAGVFEAVKAQIGSITNTKTKELAAVFHEKLVQHLQFVSANSDEMQRLGSEVFAGTAARSNLEEDNQKTKTKLEALLEINAQFEKASAKLRAMEVDQAILEEEKEAMQTKLATSQEDRLNAMRTNAETTQQLQQECSKLKEQNTELLIKVRRNRACTKFRSVGALAGCVFYGVGLPESNFRSHLGVINFFAVLWPGGACQTGRVTISKP